jgi:hypothetical protein
MRCVPQLDDLNVIAIAPKFPDLVSPPFFGLTGERFQVASGLLRELLYPIIVSIHSKNHEGRM